MKVTRGYAGGERRPCPVVTIGNFDGHHLGHRTLLDRVVQSARRLQGSAMVLTFDPHPVKILAPHVDLKFLTSPEEKLQRFEAAGIDEVVFLEFTPSFAAFPPEVFAREVLYRGLRVRQIFVGQHFAFGKGRTGTVATLTSLGQQFGFSVDPVEPVLAEGGAGRPLARPPVHAERPGCPRCATGAGVGLADGQSESVLRARAAS